MQTSLLKKFKSETFFSRKTFKNLKLCPLLFGWVFKVTDSGKRRQLAVAHVNMRKYASAESSQHDLHLHFKPTTKKITSANLECTLSCVLLREGKAT